MRAGCRDAIGQLADGGDDCAEPGLEWRAGAARLGSWQATQLASCTRNSRPSHARLLDYPANLGLSAGSQVGRSAGGAWLASRAATVAAVSATARMDRGAASLVAAHW